MLSEASNYLAIKIPVREEADVKLKSVTVYAPESFLLASNRTHLVVEFIARSKRKKYIGFMVYPEYDFVLEQ